MGHQLVPAARPNALVDMGRQQGLKETAVPAGCELQALYHFRGSEDRLLKNGHWIGPTYREQPLKLVSSNTYRGAVPR